MKMTEPNAPGAHTCTYLLEYYFFRLRIYGLSWQRVHYAHLAEGDAVSRLSSGKPGKDPVDPVNPV
jgi:hypothetical protein